MSEIYEDVSLETDDHVIEVVNQTVTRDVAVVELYVSIPGIFCGNVIGTAKRDPIDKPNRELALHLAYGRALESLSRRLLKRARGLVKHQDDLRLQKDLERGNVVLEPSPNGVWTFPFVETWSSSGTTWPGETKTYRIDFGTGKIEEK